jgi:hypothetical protein
VALVRSGSNNCKGGKDLGEGDELHDEFDIICRE